MTRNPFLNALSAAVYIALVASVMYYFPKLAGPVESVIVPIAVLSLFVLSASVMGYLFCYEPMKLYFEEKKEESIGLFLKTIGIFAVITALIFLTLFFLS